MSVERETLDRDSMPIEEFSDGVEVRLSTGKEIDLATYILASFKELETGRTALEDEWADNLKRYNSDTIGRKAAFPGGSNVSVPLTRIVVDSLQATYMNSFFGSKKSRIVKSSPIGPDDIAKSNKNENYMNWQLTEEVDFYTVMDDATQQFLGHTGNAFLEARYVIEKETVEERVTQIPEPMDTETKKTTKTVHREEVVFDGAVMDVIPSEHIYAAPHWNNAKEAAEKDILIKLMPQPLEQVRRKAKGAKPKYHNVELLQATPSSDKGSIDYAKESIDRVHMDMLKGREMVRTAEAYLWWPINGETEERVIVTLDIDTGVIFRVIKGRCTIVHLKPYPVPGRFWGRAVPSIVKPLQKHVDAAVNQFSDAATIANLPFGFYRAGGTFDPQVFTITPANFYPVDNPGDVTFAPTPKPDDSLQKVVAMVFDFLERLFAVGENVQGVQKNSATTATEALVVSKRSSVRFGAPFRRVLQQLKPLLYNLHSLNWEFAPEEKTFRILGRDGLPVFHKYTREDSKAKLNFTFDVENVYDEQLARDTWLLVFRLFRQDPQIALNRACLYRLTARAMESLVGDSSQYLPIPEEAKLPSPEETIQMLLRGDKIDPKVGIDPDNHIRVFAAFIDGPEFAELRADQKEALMAYFVKLNILKQTLDQWNLNMSGQFEGPMMPELPGMPGQTGGPQGGGMPNVTVGRNPTNLMNNARVGPGRNGGVRAEANSQIEGAGGPIQGMSNRF